jgi:DNA helicase TIP49 (TBP-interacting protein)
MGDQVGPVAKVLRYSYTLVDKKRLLDNSERNHKMNAVDLSTAPAKYANSERSVHVINSKLYTAAHRWFHHGWRTP